VVYFDTCAPNRDTPKFLTGRVMFRVPHIVLLDASFDRELVGATMRGAIRHFVNQRFRRKPVVLPIVLEV